MPKFTNRSIHLLFVKLKKNLDMNVVSTYSIQSSTTTYFHPISFYCRAYGLYKNNTGQCWEGLLHTLTHTHTNTHTHTYIHTHIHTHTHTHTHTHVYWQIYVHNRAQKFTHNDILNFIKDIRSIKLSKYLSCLSSI